MKKSRFLFIAITAFFTVSLLNGCASTGLESQEHAKGGKEINTLPITAYQPMDVKRWASGYYPEEFHGKPFYIDGYVQKMPNTGKINNDIIFAITTIPIMHPGNKSNASNKEIEAIKQMVIAIAPLDMRDILFPLRDDQKVRIYGMAEQTGSPKSLLILSVHKIDLLAN